MEKNSFDSVKEYEEYLKEKVAGPKKAPVKKAPVKAEK